MKLINTFLSKDPGMMLLTQMPKDEEERKSNIEKSKEDPKFSAINGEVVSQLVTFDKEEDVVYLVTIHKVS